MITFSLSTQAAEPILGKVYLVNNSNKNMTIYYEICDTAKNTCWYKNSTPLPNVKNPAHKQLFTLKTTELFRVKAAVVYPNKPTLYAKSACEAPASDISQPFHGTLTFDAANLSPPYVRCRLTPEPPI